MKKKNFKEWLKENKGKLALAGLGIASVCGLGACAVWIRKTNQTDVIALMADDAKKGSRTICDIARPEIANCEILDMWKDPGNGHILASTTQKIKDVASVTETIRDFMGASGDAECWTLLEFEDPS